LSLNAKLMRAYMEKHAARPEDFAPFSINAHRNALTNPNAVFHKEIGVDDYLQSRIVVDPVRLYDVSPVCNGAAAIVLASAEVAAGLLGAGRARIVIAASSAATAPLALVRRPDILHLQAVETSTQKVLAQARITHADIDFLELHDAYTIMTTMGGLKARGHPVGATGVYQLVEAFLQLSGQAGPNQVKNAEVAFVQNIGGTAATVVTHVLRRIG
jgi:acetyl-CoA C-acetyltransferase